MCLCNWLKDDVGARGGSGAPPVRMLRDLFQSSGAWPGTAGAGGCGVGTGGEAYLLDILDAAERERCGAVGDLCVGGEGVALAGESGDGAAAWMGFQVV